MQRCFPTFHEPCTQNRRNLTWNMFSDRVCGCHISISHALHLFGERPLCFLIRLIGLGLTFTQDLARKCIWCPSILSKLEGCTAKLGENHFLFCRYSDSWPAYLIIVEAAEQLKQEIMLTELSLTVIKSEKSFHVPTIPPPSMSVRSHKHCFSAAEAPPSSAFHFRIGLEIEHALLSGFWARVSQVKK